MWMKSLGCHTGGYEVSRCRTRSESRNIFYVGDKACKQGIHHGFEIQCRRHQKSKTGLSMAPQKDWLDSVTGQIMFFKYFLNNFQASSAGYLWPSAQTQKIQFWSMVKICLEIINFLGFFLSRQNKNIPRKKFCPNF